MKKIVILLCFFTSLVFGQTFSKDYTLLIQKADSLFKLKEYKNSAIAFSSAFKIYGNKGGTFDRYNAARAWALSNYPDSALDCIDRIVKKRMFTDAELLFHEKDFTSLHNDKRWQALFDFMKANEPLELPNGWTILNNLQNGCLMGIDKGAGRNGNNAATIKSIDTSIGVSGSLQQKFTIGKKYIGKRVRMSGYMKTKNVSRWAGFFFKIEYLEKIGTLVSDNMKDGKRDRSIKGTTDWKKYDLVLDVPENAGAISFGASLTGTGQIWFDDIKIEIVDNTIPTTADGLKFEPTNLNFEEKILGSERNTIAALLTFKNNLDKSVQFYWINFYGEEVYYGDLPPGIEIRQQTFMGHIFVVKNDKENKVLKKVKVVSPTQFCIVE